MKYLLSADYPISKCFKHSIGGNVEILDSFGPSWQCDSYFMLWFDVSCIEYVGGIQSSLEF